MRRSGVTAGVLATLVLAAPAAAQEIEVAPPGEPEFNDAILQAAPGETLRLPPGEYVVTAGDALEEKDLTLRGTGERDSDTTVIPSGGGEAFDEDSGVTIENLTIGEPLQPVEAAAEDEGEGGDLSTRAQVIAVIGTLAIFLFVLELVRRRRLVERYALLWMIAALALLVLAIWTDGLEVLGDLMGIEEPANAIFILAFGVAFLLLLNFSVVSSRLGEETKILAQEVAALEQQLAAEQADDDAPVPAE